MREKRPNRQRAARTPGKSGRASVPLGRAVSLRHRLERESALARRVYRRLTDGGDGGTVCQPTTGRYRTLGFCDLLLEESRQAVFDRPRHALDLAVWAAEIGIRLDRALYGEALVHDLLARAWARVGNARRVLGDHGRAETAFRTAHGFLGRGTGDLLVEAEVIDLEASLDSSQRRFGEALALLQRAAAIYRRLNDRQRLGRALISLGTVRGHSGDPGPAIDEIRRGLALIDAAAEPRLVLSAHHNLAVFLNELGHPAEARAMLARHESAYEALADDWARLRRRWLEGRIAHAEGDLGEAERALLETQQGFVDRELGYDAALVGLDLAAIYTAEGRTAEVARLAAGMVAIFRSCDVDREAVAALTVFRRAAEMEAVTVEMLRDIAAYLKSARTPGQQRPELPS